MSCPMRLVVSSPVSFCAALLARMILCCRSRMNNASGKTSAAFWIMPATVAGEGLFLFLGLFIEVSNGPWRGSELGLGS